MKKQYTKKSQLFTEGLLPKGNAKLVDFDDEKTGISYRYAQFNTRAVIDCPFRSAGCEKICYATKGNHIYTSVKESRINSHAESLREDFSEAMCYTIHYYMNNTKRYRGNVMIVRIHESGDFYSVQYLRKWIKIWVEMMQEDGVVFVLYTKSFPFFLMLAEEEKEVIRSAMRAGKLSINCSIDDTTSPEQFRAFLQMRKEFPQVNVYTCTEKTEGIPEDNVCTCADCAQCGKCNTPAGRETFVKIHSASKADMVEYRKNKRSGN